MARGPIERFAHCPACGAGSEPPAQGTGPFRCGACAFTLFFNSASATAVLLERADGAVLFIERAKDPAKGKLGMPGGFVDAGESAEEALAREVREEIGLEVDRFEYLASYANVYLYAGVTYNTIDLFFTARTSQPEAARPLDAVEALVWRDPAAVDPEDIAFDSMRRAVAAYLERRYRRTRPPVNPSRG